MGTLELSFHKKALWWLLLCLCFEEIACWVPSYSGPWILPKRTRDVSHGRRPSQSSSSLHESAQLPDLHGKTVYQRIFYRVHPSSSVAIPDSMVVEERVRFEPNDDASSSSSSNIRPIGPRTLILRDGNNADKTIGKAFLTLNVHEHRDGIQKHSGAGKDSTMQSTIALALFLASNPSLCSQGRLLELSSNFGLATLLGSIGAGFIAKGGVVEDDTGTVEHDILSIPSGTPWFPEKVESITLTDPDEDKLHLIVENIKSVGISANKAYVQKLDWSIRDIRPRGGNKNAAPAGPAEAMDFTCVVAGDVAYSFPETKMLARTVAHKLEPSYSYVDAYKPAPCFVHVSPDGRENSLRRLLEKVRKRKGVAKKILDVIVLLIVTPLFYEFRATACLWHKATS